MFRTWFLARRSAVLTTTGSIVIAAVVATTALLSTGYHAQQLSLDDGAVWVANDEAKAIGRANTAVAELNSVLKGNGADLEAVQNGSTVLMVDHASAQLSIVDAATSAAGDAVPLPPQSPEVWIAGSNVVIMARGTGQTWITSLSELQSFNPATKETLNFGKNAVATVDSNGLLTAVGPATGQVYQVDAAGDSTTAQQWSISLPSTSTDIQVSSVDGQWAVLDGTARTLTTATRTVSLADTIAADAIPELESPVVTTGGTGDSVLVASTGGLAEVPLASGTARRIVTGQAGAPAAPIQVGDCEYSAWAGAELWRRCAGSAAERLELSGNTGQSKLVFALNQRTLALNDTASGNAWAVQRSGQLIANWSALLAQQDQQQTEQNQDDAPATTEANQVPPVAVDDDLGARPGKATLLPVLLNDYDANGDVLVITGVDAPSSPDATLQLVNNDQEVMITLAAATQVHSVVTFHYTISDGRGGTATATVRVTVRAPDENSPPRQVRTTKATVAAGGQVTTQVLGDWVDPDGDPMFLQSASTTTATDRVSAKADGEVLFTDGGTGSGIKNVTLAVSDGIATGTGSLAVTVRQPGQVPITAESFEVSGYAGQTVTVSPLGHASGGNATLRLNAVPSKTGVTLVPSFDAGTFTASAAQAGTYYLDYVVTDGTQTATAQVRFDVAVPPQANSAPITIPKTVFVHFGASESVDVADSDIDPAGNVLLVSAVDSGTEADGVTAEVLEQRTVRVTLTKNIEHAVTFGYTVTNGLAESRGTITVIQIPVPAQLQPPIAKDDNVSVRVGDVIDIPVLANDEQPDGEEVTLDPELVQNVAAGGGLLFSSGDHLRYLAPKQAGNYSAVYQVSSGTGASKQTAQATVHIAVRERDAANNSAPVPQTVTARVLAGETVKITVPLTGIDPDGDSVQLLGQSSSPEKGTVTSTDEDSFEYQAGSYSTGTDTFTYTVVDALGARATGTVRVGISPRLDVGRNPIATADSVTVRPGKTVIVPVLDNDSDPDGSQLKVTKVVSQDNSVTAHIIDSRYIQVTPTTGTGTQLGFVYTIENEFGGSSSTFLTVTVDANAPLNRPVASDTVLTVTDVLDKTTLDVPVLEHVFFADGAVSSLGVALLPGYSDDAEVLPNKQIRVTVKAQSQIIPFSVSHPDDSSIRAYAFIRVPGLDDALPQLNTKASPITVRSEQSVTIDLDDYVVALGNRKVRLVDASSVSATHANGDKLVVDDHTLVYTSASQYYGPASISFEVTDGDPSDPDAHRAVLVLPITVTPRNNQPPVFTGGVLYLEPGEQRELDLVKYTNYPAQKDVGELSYSIGGDQPSGIGVTINQQHVDISVSSSTPKGTTASVTIEVRDAVNAGQSGQLKFQIVPSTRPLAIAQSDSAIAPRGQTTTVNVLANDQVTNPFPGTPLKVVAIAGIDGASLPTGVSISPSSDKSSVAVTVAQSVTPGDVNFQYEIQDATGDASRDVWGNVRISVQDRPDPVSSLRVTEFGDRTLKIAFQPGASNNSTITGYEATVSGPNGWSQVVQCTGAGTCSLPTPGNGPDNAVRISVVAVNSIGRSDPTALGGTIWSDIIPPPPTGLSAAPLDGGLRISWSKPATADASPITYYLVSAAGTTVTVGAPDVTAADPTGTTYQTTISSAAMVNGSAVQFTVSARNSAPNSLATWNSSTGTGVPAGAPIANGTPSAASASSSSVSVNWAGVFNNNGKTISRYWAVAYPSSGAAPTCSSTGVESGGTAVAVDGEGSVQATIPGLSANVNYSVMVFAFNGQGCTGSSSASVVLRVAPSTVSGISAIGPVDDGVSAQMDYQITGMTFLNAGGDVTVRYRYVDSGGTSLDGNEYTTTYNSPLLTNSGLQYGRHDYIQVKACVKYPELAAPLCSSDWSATRDLGGMAVEIDPQGLVAKETVAPTDTTPAQGTWTGTSGPSAPPYDKAEYSCDGGTTWGTLSLPGSCATQSATAGAEDFPDLQIRVTANNGTKYVRSFPWTKYVQN